MRSFEGKCYEYLRRHTHVNDFSLVGADDRRIFDCCFMHYITHIYIEYCQIVKFFSS